MSSYFRLPALCAVLFSAASHAVDVTLEQDSGQADPTNASPINFVATFSGPINAATFDCSDVALSGISSASCLQVGELPPMDNTRYQISITANDEGTVTATIPGGGIQSQAGMPNTLSSSTDGSVTVDRSGPANRATISSPEVLGRDTNAPIIGSCGSDAANGRVEIRTIGDVGFTPQPATAVLDNMGGFNIPVVWNEGRFSLQISCFDNIGNGPTVTSDSPFPPIVLDLTPPTISVNQNLGQADPTNEDIVEFAVVISEDVRIDTTAVNCSTFDFSASTTTTVGCNSFEILTIFAAGGGGTIINAVVRAIVSGDGDVIVSVPAGRFTDAAGNPNPASSSTDNQVQYLNIVPELSILPTDGLSVSGQGRDITDIRVTDSQGRIVCNTMLTGNSWNCTPLPNDIAGDGETITANATPVMFMAPDAVMITADALRTNPDKDRDGIPDRVEGYQDRDNDGLDDFLDIDTDGDGIPDVIEAGDPVDRDGDGISDRFDVDQTFRRDPEGDGIDNENILDRDRDGIADYNDLDSDNDSLPDRFESGITGMDDDNDNIDNHYDVDATGGQDINNDGIDDEVMPLNTDGRLAPDFLTPDSDGDGLSDALESNFPAVVNDVDNDGIDDTFDADVFAPPGTDPGKTDADNDGYDDSLLALINTDTDGDMIANRYDLDSDNDSILDATEAGVPDAANDGFIDPDNPIVNIARDTDSDGTPDYLDPDGDNVPGFDIAGTEFASSDMNNDGQADFDEDLDRDGIMLAIDRAPDVFGNAVIPRVTPPTTPTPPDTPTDPVTPGDEPTTPTQPTPADPANPVLPGGSALDCDGDRIPDAVEIVIPGGQVFDPRCNPDSDGDGIGDLLESGLFSSGIDSDGDGIDNAFDADANGDGELDVGRQDINRDGITDGIVFQIRDSDGDGMVDMLDTDSDNDGFSDADEGLNDFDNNGIQDYIDPNPPVSVADRGAGSTSLLGTIALLSLLLLAKRRILFILLLSAAGSAQANWLDQCKQEWGLEAAYGLSRIDASTSGTIIRNDSGDQGFKLTARCEFIDRVSAEVFYADLGEIGIGNLNPALNPLGTLGNSSYGLSARYRLPVLHPRMGVFGRAGLQRLEGDSSGNIPLDSSSSVKTLLGVGADWFITPRLSLVVNYDQFTDRASLLSAGISYHFGTPKDFPIIARQTFDWTEQEVTEVEPQTPQPKGTPVEELPELIVAYDPSIPVETPVEPIVPKQAVAVSPPVTPSVKPPVINIGLLSSNIVTPEIKVDDFTLAPLKREELDVDSCARYEVAADEAAVSVGFAFNHAGLTFESYEKLQHFAACMQYQIPGKLIIEGHTDSLASQEYNQKLSLQRALTVQAFLQHLKLPSDRMSVVGLGESHLQREENSAVDEARNRRVDIYIE